MKIRSLLIALIVAFIGAPCAFALQPRITFTRIVPAPHDLAPAEQVAVIYAIGDNHAVNDFVDTFVNHVNRSGTLIVENAVDRNQHLADFASLKRQHHADVYLGVNHFTCSEIEKTAEGSEHDPDGGRVKKTHHWIDVVCTARLDALSAGDGKKTMSFSVRGEGTSPRSIELTNDERDVAYSQAARFAAIAAAEAITPRTVRETIELDSTAPAFDEAYSMIASERFADARAIWEAALRQHRDSAALRYNLGALSEAMRDYKAAEGYFEEAQKLAPKETRYRSELLLLKKRNP
jgi:tetratricopeptide (TPR) repeat protein